MPTSRTKPVVAVTPCATIDDYLARIEEAGGTPRIVDPSATDLGDATALLLTGGGDIEAARYGEARHPADYEVEPERDALEFTLCRSALAHDVPMLGICRGLQLLNVVADGSLVQDISTQVPRPLTHRVIHPRDGLAHEVRVSLDSRLATLLHQDTRPDGTCLVNSRHHQAIKRVGEGLVVTAVAGDGVIEAVERPSARFCIAVQWHPENFRRTPAFGGLFRGLVEAAIPA